MFGISKTVSAALVVIGLCCVLDGCASNRPVAEAFTPTGSTGIVTGDWDDVNAAVEAAAEHRQMAVVSEKQVDEKTLRYDLITARSESVTVTVSRDLAVDPNVRLSHEGPIAMKVSVKVGLFGDTRREQELIDDIRTRLTALIGPFKTEPLPKSWGGWGS